MERHIGHKEHLDLLLSCVMCLGKDISQLTHKVSVRVMLYLGYNIVFLNKATTLFFLV